MSKFVTAKCLEKKYLSFLSSQEVKSEPFYNKLGQFKNFYLPICEKIYKDYKKNNKIKIIGLTGGQGAGKSTITQIVRLILNYKYNLKVTYFSIDDFYKTLKQRTNFANKISKLFKIRGVPGTHDTGLLKKTFSNLMKKNFKPVLIPTFDKSRDDRAPKKKWKKINHQPNIIIFEGWCVGANSQTNKDLKKPINILEKNEDPKLTWRKRVNKELKNEYRKIFDRIDKLIFLKVPNFECVYKWSLLQEKKLHLTSKGKKIMSASQIRKFIMYYQRITLQMLKDLTNKSDVVLYLDNKHRLNKIRFN